MQFTLRHSETQDLLPQGMETDTLGQENWVPEDILPKALEPAKSILLISLNPQLKLV